eukprot:12932558-Prorocentrum_lima.AAC.1
MPSTKRCRFLNKNGTCRFGEKYRFKHVPPHHHLLCRPLQKGGRHTSNPERKQKKPCPFIKKEGGCWYGVKCKFDKSPGSDQRTKPSTPEAST